MGSWWITMPRAHRRIRITAPLAGLKTLHTHQGMLVLSSGLWVRTTPGIVRIFYSSTLSRRGDSGVLLQTLRLPTKPLIKLGGSDFSTSSSPDWYRYGGITLDHPPTQLSSTAWTSSQGGGP